jgi:hypothetical protein
MSDKLSPPFTIGSTEESAWVQDAEGKRFGYVYWRAQALVGTDSSGRLSKALAIRTVRWIKRQAEAAGRP